MLRKQIFNERGPNLISKYLLRFVTLLLTQTALAASVTAPAVSAEINLGINYSWFKLGSPVAECELHPAAVLKGSGILPQYNEANVRETVRAQLSTMRNGGFTTIRTFVSLQIAPRRDVGEGPLTSESGSISRIDKANLAAFVTDIGQAGFKTLEVSYGSAGIFCHHREWGDCFNPRDAERQWIFDRDATQDVVMAAGKVLHLRFDLGNEGCPAPTMPQQTRENARGLFVMLARNFSHQFGPNWLVSCPDSPGDVRQSLMLRYFKDENLAPGFLEVHNYSDDTNKVQDALSEANEMASQIGAQLILGEVAYHSDAQAKAILDWTAHTPNSHLIDIIQWPRLKSSERCPINVSPPFDPGPYKVLNSR